MSIVSIPADLTKGADPSPWTLDGTDLYTDSTSYLVAIGLTDPDAFLHIKGVENTPTVKLETAGSGTTHKFFQFKNGAATTESNPPYLYPDNAGGYTRVRFKGSGALTPFIFDDGVAFRGGGNAIQFDGGSANIGTTGVTMRIEVNTGFGLATSNFTPSGAMLHIKDASNAQLKLDDGSNHALLKHSGNDLTFNIDGGGNDNLSIEADTGKFLFKSNAGANSTITLDANNSWSSFPYLGVTNTFEAHTIKAGSYVAATNGIIINYGLRFANVAKSGNYTMLASDHVVNCTCPSGTPGMTITLPASTAGRMVKIIDSAGSCSNASGSEKHIRVTPASGTINGSTHVDIENAYGSVFAICDGTNWTITN